MDDVSVIGECDSEGNVIRKLGGLDSGHGLHEDNYIEERSTQSPNITHYDTANGPITHLDRCSDIEDEPVVFFPECDSSGNPITDTNVGVLTCEADNYNSFSTSNGFVNDTNDSIQNQITNTTVHSPASSRYNHLPSSADCGDECDPNTELSWFEEFDSQGNLIRREESDSDGNVIRREEFDGRGQILYREEFDQAGKLIRKEQFPSSSEILHSSEDNLVVDTEKAFDSDGRKSKRNLLPELRISDSDGTTVDISDCEFAGDTPRDINVHEIAPDIGDDGGSDTTLKFEECDKDGRVITPDYVSDPEFDESFDEGKSNLSASDNVFHAPITSPDIIRPQPIYPADRPPTDSYEAKDNRLHENISVVETIKCISPIKSEHENLVARASSPRAAARWHSVVNKVLIGSGSESPREWANQEPEWWVSALASPTVQTYAGLKRQLAGCPPEWIPTFLRLDGLPLLLQALERLCSRNAPSLLDTYLQIECVQCIRAIMNSQMGLDYIVENRDFTRKLATGKAFDPIKYIIHSRT